MGIDQTGAALERGRRARPLPAALAAREPRTGRWRLVVREGSHALALPALDAAAVRALLARHAPEAAPGRVALHVDGAFGLPHEVMARLEGSERALTPARAARALRACLRDAGAYSLDGKLYGRDVAEAWFSALARRAGMEPGEHPVRRCERLSGANSVFVTRPYQRNVQTGTFRLWRELGAAGMDSRFRLWPFELDARGNGDRPWLLEGFPTLVWKRWLGLRTRDPAALGPALAQKGWTLGATDALLLGRDPDLADAAVLAAGGATWAEAGTLLRPGPAWSHATEPRIEGWITGLEIPDDLEA